MSEHYRRMPVERLGVSAAAFAALLNTAAAQWRANETDRYLAGVLTCAQWIAGITDGHPIHDRTEPCTAEAMESCQLAAYAVVYGNPWAPDGIDVRWARGVAATVAWARGALRRPPIDLPAMDQAA